MLHISLCQVSKGFFKSLGSWKGFWFGFFWIMLGSLTSRLMFIVYTYTLNANACKVERCHILNSNKLRGVKNKITTHVNTSKYYFQFVPYIIYLFKKSQQLYKILKSGVWIYDLTVALNMFDGTNTQPPQSSKCHQMD